MKASSVNINKSIQAVSVYLVHRISQEDGCREQEALIQLLKTMTYELLQDRESGLYAESSEYTWHMLQNERNGNTQLWING